MAKIKSGDVVDIISFSKASAPIGEVKQSMLTLEQFEEENLGTWMLCDGSACEGTAYESLTGSGAVPDMRGAFARMKDHGAGRDTERTLGNYQADEFKSHRHGYKRSWIGKNGVMWQDDNDTISTGFDNVSVATVTSNKNAMSYEGGVETRPKNVTLNFFIKVDY